MGITGPERGITGPERRITGPPKLSVSIVIIVILVILVVIVIIVVVVIIVIIINILTIVTTCTGSQQTLLRPIAVVQTRSLRASEPPTDAERVVGIPMLRG